MMTYKEFEKAVHSFDSFLGDEFYNYVSDCIIGEGEENDIFDAPVIFECSDSAWKAHLSQLKKRLGIYLFVMDCDYLFGNEQINDYSKIKGAKLNFREPRVLHKDSIFYVGSKNDSVYERIGQHLNRTEKSLALGSNYRHFMCERLRIVVLPIKNDVAELLKTNEMTKPFLLLMENSLHKYWNPHAGTAR